MFQVFLIFAVIAVIFSRKGNFIFSPFFVSYIEALSIKKTARIFDHEPLMTIT